MTDNQYFVGIDLGTTNSVIAWCSDARHKGEYIPKPIKVEFLDRGGHSVREEILPSVVYFKESFPPIVGEFARTDAYQSQPHLVVKSIKSKMGSKGKVVVGGEKYTPAEISSIILKQLRAATLDNFANTVEDVIITVPASFDHNMRLDTLEAARLAGFKGVNPDGSEHDLLLDEPRAALYCLIHQQQMGDINPSIIDLSTTKTVLIYDLGGGTLDVSLHRVCADKQTFEIDVEDIAISRYTRIGGDNFDQLIADYFEAQFEEKTGIRVAGIREEYIRHEIHSKFLLEAEQKKRELNNHFYLGLRQGSSPDNLRKTVTTKILLPNLYDNSPYSNPRFTWDELEEIIKPLLGLKLSIKDVDRFDRINENFANNIIYPILDVLHKARIRLGYQPKIDAVFLNGGMTRFVPVQQRLEKLFGIRPITILDPDKSVALGASLYHNALHQGRVSKSIIQAETIGIEIQGKYVQHLIGAGTILPTLKPIVFDKFYIPEGSNEITLAFYRGEGKTPSFPNVKLIEKVVRLSDVCHKPEQLHVEVSVDRNKILTFAGHLVSNPDIKIFAQIGDGENHSEVLSTDLLPAKATIRNTNQKIILGSTFLTKNLPEPIISQLEVNDTIDALFSLNPRAKKALEKIIKRILFAQNREQFIQPLALKLSEAPVEEMMANIRIYTKAIIALGKLALAHPNHHAVPGAFSALIRVCVLQSSMSTKDKKYSQLTNAAVVSLARIGNPAAEQTFLDLLENPDADGNSYTILASLTKISCSPNALGSCAKYITDPSAGKRMYAALAIGKMSSSDKAQDVSASLVALIINQILEQLQYENDSEVLNCLIYALSELANPSSTIHQISLPIELVNKIVNRIKEIDLEIAKNPFPSENDKKCRETINMAINMVSGEPLFEDQKRVLLFMRSKLETIGDNDE